MMTGITGRSGWRERNSRISSFTVGRVAATAEHSTISAAAASIAAMVASVSEWPPVKSSRSRKIGRSVFGTGPRGVSRPARSWSMRNDSSLPCSHFAHLASAWAYDRKARYLKSTGAGTGAPSSRLVGEPSDYHSEERTELTVALERQLTEPGNFVSSSAFTGLRDVPTMPELPRSLTLQRASR
jgi:hypothetical protein